ncbi:MAG: DNA translocase FtsK 4TM domain-containing protein [Alphaproteobacteria bacterium]|nr:DNA translocase FtsK 4TM domain-containing protein [Alphaproteobacteria bacterium]
MAARTSVRTHAPRSPLIRLGGFALVCLAFYLSLSLLTYHAADPSLNHATPGAVHNAGGYAGAILANLTLQILGLASALLVLVPLSWGIKLLSGRPVFHLWLRATMLLCAMVLLSALLASVHKPVPWPITSGLGGAVGTLLHDGARHWFGNVFFLVFLSAFAVMCSALAFGMTATEWRMLVRSVRHAAMLAYALGAALVLRLRVWHGGRSVDEGESMEEMLEYYGDDAEDLPWYWRTWHRLAFWQTDAEDEAEEEENEEEEEEAARPPRRRVARAAAKPAPRPAPRSQGSLALPKGDYALPSLSLLSSPGQKRRSGMNEAALQQNARLLETVLRDFGVNGQITEIRPGPVVTLYELEPAAGTKSSRVIGLSDDIARSMSAVSARIAVIAGRNAIGIELPNAQRETVYLREMLESDAFETNEARLPLALGKDIGGSPVVVDLARMPHLLVAGTTGSGKSVAINTMILSLAYRLTPDECKFIMIDPKMLELSGYDGIPHLLTPVVTESGKAVVALKWTVKEMENRYRLMSNLGVRNIDGYNKAIREAKARGKQLSRRVQTGFDVETGQPVMEEMPLDMMELPYIVVIVDEMADLMILAGKDIESSIQRLAQMARAAGIHLIMATQRPSVDVITGVIKANFPTRISFQVTSRIDSRTILGEQGAEQLLGQGDMLYMAGGGRITRVHGPLVSDREVAEVVAHLRLQGEPSYIEEATQEEDEEAIPGEEGERDEMYDQAVSIVARDRKASTSYLQRCMKIGYNRAATLIERMEREGVVSPANHVGKREVLVRESA